MTDSVVEVKIVNRWEALHLLQEAAYQKLTDEPDYVYRAPGGEYSTCVNLEVGLDGQLVGSCLIGRVFVLLGIEPDTSWSSGSFSYVSIMEPIAGKLKFSEKARFLLQMAQNLQDCKMPWKYVLEAVEQANANLYLGTGTEA